MSTTGGRSAAQVGSSLLGAPPGKPLANGSGLKPLAQGSLGLHLLVGSSLTRSHVRGYAPSTTNGYILGGNPESPRHGGHRRSVTC